MSQPHASPQPSPQHSPQLAPVSASAPPPVMNFTAQETMERIALLEASNAQGHALVAQLQAKLQVSSARSPHVRVPAIPSFSGAVGFGVDSWLRNLQKHFVFYGNATFPDEHRRLIVARSQLPAPLVSSTVFLQHTHGTHTFPTTGRNSTGHEL